MPKRSWKKTLLKNLTSRRRDSSQEHLEKNRHQIQTGVSQTPHSDESFPENSARPTRAAKVKCLQNLTNIIQAERSYNLDVSRERASQRLTAENDDQRERRLQDLRQRASQRVAAENYEQRERRLQDMRQRVAQHVQEIKAELSNLKTQSLLQKLSSSSYQRKTDDLLSIKVEIEEYDEELTDEEIFPSTYNDPDSEKEKVMSLDTTIANPENSIIKTECADIETVKNGQELLKDCKSDRDDKVVQDMNIRIESVRSLQNVDKIEVSCYKMTKIMIKKEFEIFSKTTVSYTDKLLEIHIRNYFGQDISEVKLNQTEVKIQEVIKIWGTWMTCDPLIRDTPLMYICSICQKAWWYLHDLKEHIKYHGRFGITLCTQDHYSYVVVTNERKMRDCRLPIESNCWRCGKDVSHHSHKSFKCDGCEESFHTCLLLTMHEGDCNGNRKFYQRASDNTYLEFKCPICPWKHWKEEELLRHQVGLHSVRSDLPVPLERKKCGRCNKFVSQMNAHDCIVKQLKESCKFCFRKFPSKNSLLLHYWVSPDNNFKCRVCGKLLKKECVEFEHLLEHTDNYKMLYMCLVCKDSLCFFDLHSVKNHTTSCHINKEKTDGDYCPVVVPKSLLQRLEPMKVFVTTPEDIYIDRNVTTHEEQDVDSAFQGLLGYLNKNAVKKTPQNEETVNIKNNIDFENNIQIIYKDIVQKIMNSVKSNDIPDIIKNIKNENTEDINNSNKNTLQRYNYKGNLHVSKNNDGPDKKLNTYSQTSSKQNLQSTDVGDGIKEYVTTDVAKIKEEPMDIDEINGINEVNDIDLIDNNKNNNININNEMNDVVLNSVLQQIDDINLPIKLEIKEESNDMLEDDIILLNKNVLNSTKSRKNLPKAREEKDKELKKELKRKRNRERQREYYQRQKDLKKNEENKKEKKVPKTNAERQREFRQRRAEKSYVDIPPDRKPSKRSRDVVCDDCKKMFLSKHLLDVHTCSAKTATAISPALLGKVKPMQIRISRCDSILESSVNGHYDVSNVPFDYGLDSDCIYPYISRLRIKSEPSYMVDINDEIKEAFDADKYIHWDSEDTASDVDVEDQDAVKKVDSLTSKD